MQTHSAMPRTYDSDIVLLHTTIPTIILVFLRESHKASRLALPRAAFSALHCKCGQPFSISIPTCGGFHCGTTGNNTLQSPIASVNPAYPPFYKNEIEPLNSGSRPVPYPHPCSPSLPPRIAPRLRPPELLREQARLLAHHMAVRLCK